MQRAVVLRVGVTIKQIENEHLQNELVFRVWIIGGGTLPPNAPCGYRPGVKPPLGFIKSAYHGWLSMMTSSEGTPF